MSIILRFISAVYTIFIIVPLCFIMFLGKCVFLIANGFTYHNYMEHKVPYERVIDAARARGMGPEWDRPMMLFARCFKPFVIIISPIVELFQSFHSCVKTIQF